MVLASNSIGRYGLVKGRDKRLAWTNQYGGHPLRQYRNLGGLIAALLPRSLRENKKACRLCQLKPNLGMRTLHSYLPYILFLVWRCETPCAKGCQNQKSIVALLPKIGVAKLFYMKGGKENGYPLFFTLKTLSRKL